jgi:hypothetical protein
MLHFTVHAIFSVRAQDLLIGCKNIRHRKSFVGFFHPNPFFLLLFFMIYYGTRTCCVCIAILHAMIRSCMPHLAENGSSISACFRQHVAVQSFPYLFFFSNQLADDVNTCVDAAQPAPYL